MKLQRATRHLDELEAQVAEYLRNEPFTVNIREDGSTGDLEYVVHVREQPPAEWGATIGDIVHNARSSLDIVVRQLVLANGATPSRATAFPIGDDELGFRKVAKKYLKGVSTETRDRIEAMEPWSGGHEWLWMLHRLDIMDKHHQLIPVGAATQGVTFEGTFTPPWGGETRPLPSFVINAADKQYPLADGAVVFTVKKGAQPLAEKDSGFTMAHRPVFFVAFGEGEAVGGRAVVPTLRDVVKEAQLVVGALC